MAAESASIDETRKETWAAAGYELYIEFDGRDTQRLSAALDALWRHPRLDGPYDNHASRFSEQQKVLPSSGIDPDVPVHRYGTVQLCSGERVPCGSVAHIWPDHDDALTLYVPAGVIDQLGRDIDQPPPADMVWFDMVDETLAEVAEAVFSASAFEVATIGHGALSIEAADTIRAGDTRPSWLPAYLRAENSVLRFTPSGDTPERWPM
jgi:hypothetical protein